MTIHEMQNLNRATIEHASKVIVPGMTLIELRKLCEEYMLSHGADSFWYWDVGAFVFAGDKTTVSVSGREYKTDDHIIEPNGYYYNRFKSTEQLYLGRLRKNSDCRKR